ncbi:MAG: hypothetical protein RRZ65_09550 [Tannerellaceae bacterium]
MRGEEYTFVTLDSDDAILSDAVVVDVDEGGDFAADAVFVDDGSDGFDFITLSDDTVMMSDNDMQDLYSTDIDGSDISFMI